MLADLDLIIETLQNNKEKGVSNDYLADLASKLLAVKEQVEGNYPSLLPKPRLETKGKQQND